MRRDWTADWPPRDKSQDPNGYVYVIEFTGGPIKVGRTDNPRMRNREHERAAAKFGRRAWVSPLHGAWVRNKAHLIEEAERIGTRIGGCEYFEVSYDHMLEMAAELDMERTPLDTELLLVTDKFADRVAYVLAVHAAQFWKDLGYASFAEYHSAEVYDLEDERLTQDEQGYKRRAYDKPWSEFDAAERQWRNRDSPRTS